MACGSSCCGPPKESATAADSAHSNYEASQIEAAVSGAADDSYDVSIPTARANDGGGCGVDPGAQDNCCLPAAAQKPEHETEPDCCKGKASPCCDSACIDRLALRECEKVKPDILTTETLRGMSIFMLAPLFPC